MTKANGAGRESGRVVSPPRRAAAALCACLCLLAGLAYVPPARTQTKARPQTKARAGRPAQGPTRTAPSGPVIPFDNAAPPPPQTEPAAAARPTPQATPPPANVADARASDDDEVVRVETSEVLLPVTVRDESGRLVPGLRREDFRVYEDGREQRLSGLSLRQAPVDVALLVDSSSSVAASFEDFRRAADEFAGRVAPEDRFSLVKFDDRVELLLDWSQSRLQLRRALRRLSTGVFTRFNDALLVSAREHFRRDQRRRALVVLSDGIDSGRGASTLEDALRALLEAQVTVYVISNTAIARAAKQAELDNLLGGAASSVRFNELRIGDLREGLRVLDASERNLEHLTRATGGRLYRPDDFRALDRVYSEIAEELRHQYALYYTPTDPARDGRFRRVRVEIRDRPLRVNTRVGYFAPRG